MIGKISIQKRLYLFLVPICLLLYLLNPYRGWLILLVGFGAALVFSYLWTKALRKNLTFIHERRYSWAQVGDTIEERFAVQNHGWLPAVWVEIDYRTDMPDYRPNRAVSIANHTEYTWVTRGICTRRGLFTLGPLTVRTGDPLGIFDLEMHNPATSTILVEPPAIPLPKIEIAPGGRSGDSRTRGQSFERSVSVSNVREYAPGDSIRMIHWPTTARTGKYFVRILESRPASNWWVFLDLDEKSSIGSGFDSSEENGVILAASLVELGLQSGTAVGLVTQTDTLAWHPPRFGEAHRHDIMRTLALAASGPIALGPLLRQARPMFKQNPSLIIITANMSPTWLSNIMPMIKRHVIPTVMLLDPRSYPVSDQKQESPDDLVNQLVTLGITHTLLSAQMFDRPEARPGVQGRWLWRNTPSATAVPVSKPADLPWQRI